ncbi:MAG: MSC_0882 family membrane protein [Mycoplasma sp.]
MKNFERNNETNELDPTDISDKWDSKSSDSSTSSSTKEEAIWSEPLEDKWGMTKTFSSDQKDKTQVFNTKKEESIKPNSTEFKEEETKFNNIWESNANFDSIPEVLFEQEKEETKIPERLKTVRFVQSVMDFDKEFTKAFAPSNLKTAKIIFDTPEKEEITKPLDDSENIQIVENEETKKLLAEEKKRIKLENKKLKKEAWKLIPNFYRFEMINLLVMFTFSSILLFAAFSSLGYVIYAFLDLELNAFWLSLPSIAVFLTGFASFNCGINYLHFKKEMKRNNGQFDFDLPYSCVKKLYRKLVTANVTLTWVSVSIYMFLLIGIFLTYMVAYFINLSTYFINDFSALALGGFDYSTVYAVWTMVGIICLTFIRQVVYTLINKRRKNEIEIFYKKELIEDEIQMKLRKSANIKGAICFATSTLIFGLVILITYYIMKKSVKK